MAEKFIVPVSEALAFRLRRIRERAVREFEARMRREIASVKRWSSEEIINSLPAWIEQISVALSRQTGSACIEICREHGRSRSSRQSFSLSDLFHEYRIIRQVILDGLEADVPLSREERGTILDVMEMGSDQSASEFIRLSSVARIESFDPFEPLEENGELERAIDGIIAIDQHWRITYLNRPAYLLLYGNGYPLSRDELLTRPLWEYPPRLIEPRFFWAQLHALNHRQAIRFEEFYPKLASWYSVSVFPSKGGITAYFHDFTQLKNAEVALENSEATFRTLVEGVRDYAIFMLDPDAKVSSWNPGAERILQYGSQEIIGKPESVLYSAEDVRDGRPARNLARATIEGQSEDEWWRVRKDGSRFWASVNSTAIYDQTGKLQGYAKVVRDLSERKRVEERQQFLAYATTQIGETLDAMRIVAKVAELAVPEWADLCLVDLKSQDGAFERVILKHKDPKGEELLQELQNRYWPFLDLPVGPNRSIRTGQPVIVPLIEDSVLLAFAKDPGHVEKLKELGIISFVSVPLFAAGRVVGAVTFGSTHSGLRYNNSDLEFFEELGRRASSAIENARLYDELKRATSLREEVVAIVSHDLKNPLTTVETSLTILKHLPMLEECNQEVGKAIWLIERGVSQMKRLISDLADLVRLQAGGLSLHSQETNAIDLVREVVRMYQPAAVEKKIDIRGQCPESPILMKCDRDRILQVLMNLVGNAVKFTSYQGKIVVGVKDSAHQVEFTVEDSGPGIAEKDLPFVFDRYWQAQKDKKKGTGLGLSIARGIVELHQGQIGVDSEVGRGSKFYFRIPRQPAPRLQSAA